MRILFLAGSPRRESAGRQLIEHAAEYARRRYPEHEVDVLSLAEEAPEPFRGHEEEYSHETRDVVARVEAAHALVIAAPVFNGSYAAAVKNLFEHVNYKAMEDGVAGLVLVAAGERGFMQARSNLDQLLTYFNVHVIPRAVYALRSDVEEGISEELAQRLENLVDKVIATQLAVADFERARGFAAKPRPA